MPKLSGRLLQEDVNSPWEVLVACVLMNRATGKKAREVFPKLTARWPNPESMGRAVLRSLAAVLRPLGFQNVRAARLRGMSAGYASGCAVEALYGVGRYGLESLRIFVDGDIDFRPGDVELRKYVRRARRARQKQGS
jgi:methyl-CpG-binding domain protein 4